MNKLTRDILIAAVIFLVAGVLDGFDTGAILSINYLLIMILFFRKKSSANNLSD